MKPQKGSKVRQGYFTPSDPSKYLGDPSNIVYRSSWELKFLQYCDKNDKIVEYSAEAVSVMYFNPFLKRPATYWIDCYMATKGDDGSITKWLIEVKPNKFLNPPTAPKRMTDKQTLNYARHAKAYMINAAKFEAAKNYAQENGMKFGIITENFLFKQKY